MAGMALAEPCPIALADDNGRRVAPHFGNLADAGTGEMLVEDLDRLEPEPGVDHRGPAIRKIADNREDRLVARFAEQAIMVAVARAEMDEEGFLHRVEREQRPPLGLGDRPRHCALAGGGHAVHQYDPLHGAAACACRASAASPAPMTPARSPSSAGTTSH